MPIEILIRKIHRNIFVYVKLIILRRNTRFLEIYLNQDFNVIKRNSEVDKIINNNIFFNLSLRDLLLFSFSSLGDIVTVDYPNRSARFDVIFNLLSFKHFCRLFYIIQVGAVVNYSKNQFYIKSLTNVYNSANWLERENWDLFGIFFQDHFDLRRILTDYGFEGYPLRKDFPLTGFIEVRYDDEQRSVIYENLELSQEFRFFDFESPWVKE
jgi:NADH-quinone oxidoreductase subunit C